MDAWRGYYTYEPTVDDVKEGTGEEALLTECNFVGHPDNDEFMKITRKNLRRYFNIRTRTGRTSNVFSTNVVITASPKSGRTWTPELKAKAKEFDDLFVDYYTRGFSIFSGETYPIDLKGYREKVEKV